MSFSYGVSLPIDIIRLLIADTNPAAPIFQDEEISRFYIIQASTIQSSMFFSGQQNRPLPYMPLSYLRVAALALDSMASNKAYLASIKQLLDVKLDSSDAAKMLMQKADGYRKVEDESGAFMIIEQCTTTWAFKERYWNQVQRQTAGGYYP